MGNIAPQAQTLPKLTSEWAASRTGSSGWVKYLDAIFLSGMRGWSGQSVEFRFPVVAIAGENGSGKSTVLKAAAAAYINESRSNGSIDPTYYPDDFFPSTPWETISNVSLGYQIYQGPTVKTYSLRKRTRRWRGMPERPKRSVFFLDISRTQPIDTLIGYGKVARVEISQNASETPLDDDHRGVLSRILKRSYSDGKIIRNTQGKQVGVVSSGTATYSNFHQGAGEDTTMDLVALLQEIPRNSLLLIDEVESSLHPRAQRRLMTELISICTSKRVQLIATTHSPYVLEQLPPEARIYIQNDTSGVKQVLYGVTPEYALSRMDDVDHPELLLYCEDSSSTYTVEALVSKVSPETMTRIRTVSVGPASTVKTLGGLADKDKLPAKTICVLDGDQPPSPGCIVLPGEASPEGVAFNALGEEDWKEVATRLGVRIGDLLDAKDDALRLDDVHTWARRIAEGLHSAIRPSRVFESVIDVWVADVLTEADRKDFVDQVLDNLQPLGS